MLLYMYVCVFLHCPYGTVHVVLVLFLHCPYGTVHVVLVLLCGEV